MLNADVNADSISFQHSAFIQHCLLAVALIGSAAPVNQRHAQSVGGCARIAGPSPTTLCRQTTDRTFFVFDAGPHRLQRTPGGRSKEIVQIGAGPNILR
jgi:hypothetical protein